MSLKLIAKGVRANLSLCEMQSSADIINIPYVFLINPFIEVSAFLYN